MTTPSRAKQLVWHNDGEDFLCMACGAVVHRTRTNPYPDHSCEDSKPKKKCSACGGQGWVYSEHSDFWGFEMKLKCKCQVKETV